MKKLLMTLLGLLSSPLCGSHMDMDAEKKIAFARERHQMMKKSIESKRNELQTVQKSIAALKAVPQSPTQLTALTARSVQLNKEIDDLVKESEITQNSMQALSRTK